MMKSRILSLAIALILFLSSASYAAEAPAPRGFDTPEACAAAVTDALIAGDTRAYIDCFAIPEMARSFDLDFSIKTYNALQPGNTLLKPSNDFAIAYNEGWLRNSVLTRVMGACVTLKHGDANIWGRILSAKEYTTEQLSAYADTADILNKFAYKGAMAPEQADERYASAFARFHDRYIGLYGMDEIQETIVILDFEGREVYMPLMLARYGESWLAAAVTPIITGVVGAPGYLAFAAKDML